MKGHIIFLNEELPSQVEKMAFEAHEARRSGLISKCTASQYGVTLTTHQDELIDVYSLTELFDVLSRISDNDTNMEVDSTDAEEGAPKKQRPIKRGKCRTK